MNRLFHALLLLAFLVSVSEANAGHKRVSRYRASVRVQGGVVRSSGVLFGRRVESRVRVRSSGCPGGVCPVR